MNKLFMDRLISKILGKARNVFGGTMAVPNELGGFFGFFFQPHYLKCENFVIPLISMVFVKF